MHGFVHSYVTVLLIMCQVEAEVQNMIVEDPGNVSYNALGGLSDQIRELRESIELPIVNPEIFQKVGIRTPKVCSLYGCLILGRFYIG